MLPISALIVSYNEGHFLEQCLSALDFCDEIVVIDLGSTDNSVEIAGKYAHKVVQHERVAFVEIIHNKFHHTLKNEWLLFTDPDEVITHSLKEDVRKLFIEGTIRNYSGVRVPMQYFFKGKKLKGTFWGGVVEARLLFNRTDTVFSDQVHSKGKEIIDSSKLFVIRSNGMNYIEHYWMSSYTQIIEKHRRYLKGEGRNLFIQGIKYDFIKSVKVSIGAFYHSFFMKKGYRDGITGLFLSIFRSWYIYRCYESLKIYSKTRNSNA